MNKIQASFETLPVQISPAVLSKSFGVRTDIEHHIQALSELVNLLLNQVESLPIGSNGDDMPFLNLRDEVRRFEIDLIQRALTRTRGSQVHAAKLLGVNPTTLNAKMKRYRLQWPYAASSAHAAG
jgi:DNA-binding NtrC family response regulator